MGARTGEEFLKGLRRTNRELWLGDERVDDVTNHPALAGAAQAVADVFDRQHEFADECLMPDPETGEPVNVSHMIPRSKDDLRRRRLGLVRIAESTVGLMGRTPDYMNVTFAGFAGERGAWAGPDDRNEEGVANLQSFQKQLAREDLSLTHTIIHPTIDRMKDSTFAGNPVPLHKVADTEHGIVVRGARILATLAPFADEIAVYPGHPLPPGAPDAYALSFSIPVSTPGLVFLCRDSVAAPGADPFDRPLSYRFDEQDAFVIFDDVEVPRERVFIDGDVEVYSGVMLPTAWWANIMQQTTLRALTKLEFAYGLASLMAEAVNDSSPHTLEMLGELHCYVEITRNAVLLAEEHAYDRGEGRVVPGRATAAPHALATGGLVPARQRHPRHHRQPQPAGHAQPGHARRRPSPPPDRRVPARCRRCRRRAARRALPVGVGLRGLRARRPQRSVRTQLPGLGQDEPDRGVHGVLGSQPASFARGRHPGRGPGTGLVGRLSHVE